jgi:hypothetical protein
MIIDDLIVLVLSEVSITIVLAIVILLLLILKLLGKLVVSVTVVSVKTDAASYDHDVSVKISGDVMMDGDAIPDTSVKLKIVDIKGAEFVLPDATTDSEGKFTANWTIPTEVAPGVCTVYAMANGMEVTTTFTPNNKTVRIKHHSSRAKSTSRNLPLVFSSETPC